MTILSIELLDIFFKYLAIKGLIQPRVLLKNIISITLYKNSGVAFDTPIPLPLVIALSTIIIIYLIKIFIANYKTNTPKALGVLSVIIGALGNTFDRIINNFTTDYIHLFSRSVINMSDILILLGVFTILLYNKKERE